MEEGNAGLVGCYVAKCVRVCVWGGCWIEQEKKQDTGRADNYKM